MSHVKYFQVTMIVRNAYDSSRSPHIINQFLALENEEDLETTLYMILGGHYDLRQISKESPRTLVVG